MVLGEIYRRQRPGAEILQPELCHSRPVYPAGAAGKPAYPFGGGRELAGEADESGTGCWSRETRKTDPSGMWGHQYVHRFGRAGRHCSLPPEA